MGLQYGIKEVTDCSVLDFKTKEPLFFTDYASVTTNENNAERLDVTGGRGNAKLLSFDHSKTSTFIMSLPLVDLNTLAMLTGEDIASGADVGNIFKREVLTVKDNSGTLEVELSQTPVGEVKIYKLEGLRDNGEKFAGTVSGKTVTITTPSVDGEEVVAFYQHVAPTSAKKISIKSTKFPKAVEIYGTGLARNQEDEQDYPCHVHVFKARPQANFTFTMEGTNATNLEITFDMYEVKNGKGEGQYIDYIFETE